MVLDSKERCIMAKEQWKKIGVVGGTVGLAIVIVGIAWAGGGRVTGVEKDIESVKGNAVEDRQSIRDVSVLVTALKDKQASDYKELKQDANDAKLRDERQSTQYTAILSHMQQQTEHVKKADESIGRIQTDVGKMQVQIETLTRD